MNRLPLLLAVLIPLTTSVAVAQAPGEPTINVKVSGVSGSGGSGAVTVSGNINVPAGWKLSIHTLTVRFQKGGTNTTMNAFGAVKSSDFTFSFTVNLKSGSYQVWAVIDVKDSEGREKQIASPAQSVSVP
jgi:hypothetical protein